MGDAALIKKLGISSGQRAAVINSPDGYADRIGLPQGVEVTTDLDGTFDFVQVFAKDRAILDRHLNGPRRPETGRRVLDLLPQGQLQSPDRPEPRRVLGSSNTCVRPVTQVSVDEVWSALRFRPFAEVGSR